eukprot:c6030_g1_i1.p1 GENE.c6030_g1_i1~~c6030_g1_i1.p1  ORF type:complete len:144 (-),score=14.38 c6030_g1_i1:19-450(-)
MTTTQMIHPCDSYHTTLTQITLIEQPRPFLSQLRDGLSGLSIRNEDPQAPIQHHEEQKYPQPSPNSESKCTQPTPPQPQHHGDFNPNTNSHTLPSRSSFIEPNPMIDVGCLMVTEDDTDGLTFFANQMQLDDNFSQPYMPYIC